MSATRAALAWCFSLYRKWSRVRNRSVQGPVFTQTFLCSKYSHILTPCILAVFCMCVCVCVCVCMLTPDCPHILPTTYLEGSLRLLDLGSKRHPQQNTKIKCDNRKDFCLHKLGVLEV